MILQKDITLNSPFVALSNYTTKKKITVQLGGSNSLVPPTPPTKLIIINILFYN